MIDISAHTRYEIKYVNAPEEICNKFKLGIGEPVLVLSEPETPETVTVLAPKNSGHSENRMIVEFPASYLRDRLNNL